MTTTATTTTPAPRRIAALLHSAEQAMSAAYAPSTGSSGITARQLILLEHVRDNPGCSQTDCVEATGIDRSTVADLVRRLMRHGLLSRRRSRQDARAYIVTLTDRGTAALDAASRAADELEQDFDKALRRDLTALLETVVAVMHARREPGTPMKAKKQAKAPSARRRAHTAREVAA